MRPRGYGGLWFIVTTPHPFPMLSTGSMPRVFRATQTSATGCFPFRAAATRLEELLRPSRQSRAFKEKMEHQSSWGPFGHLVRQAASVRMQNHFFNVPEAVVGLGYDLDAYRTATAPCIVKFRARTRETMSPN